MNVSVYSFFLIVLFCSITVCSGFSNIDMNFLTFLANHFGANFCVFEKAGSILKAIRFEKFPSKNELLTASLNSTEIFNFLSDDPKFFKFNGKTMIILQRNNSTFESLQKWSDKKRFRFILWVLFSEDHFHLTSFQNIHIPFDCEFIYVHKQKTSYFMTEIYQIKKNSAIEIYDFGNWNSFGNFSISSLSLYARRNDLKNHTFRALINHNPPFVSIEKDENGSPIFNGYLFQIWSELEFRINFKTEFPEKFFNQDPQRVLGNDDADFAVARIANDLNAFDRMDFSQPVHEAKSYVFIHRHGSELEWNSYLKPFSSDTWLINFIWVMISSLALNILYKMAWIFGTSEKESKRFIFTFSESLLTVFRAVCLQGSDVTPRSYSCRLLFLSIYLTALVVTSAFSAALFSLLTVPKPKSVFDDLNQVFRNSIYKIGIASDPVFQKTLEKFSDSFLWPWQKALKTRLGGTDTFIMTSENGLKRLCEDKFFIFLYDLPKMLYHMKNLTWYCQEKILKSSTPLYTEYISFGFTKENPYKRIITHHLTQMKNDGILHKLLLTYWPPKMTMGRAGWLRVTLADISPILYMFLMGVILGVILLYLEKFVSYLIRKKRKMGQVKRRINLHSSANEIRRGFAASCNGFLTRLLRFKHSMES